MVIRKHVDPEPEVSLSSEETVNHDLDLESAVDKRHIHRRMKNFAYTEERWVLKAFG